MQQCDNAEVLGEAAVREVVERMAKPNELAPGKWNGNRECDNASR